MPQYECTTGWLGGCSFSPWDWPSIRWAGAGERQRSFVRPIAQADEDVAEMLAGVLYERVRCEDRMGRVRPVDSEKKIEELVRR
jgi:hypothetical protein